ncbi:MFS transporter [Glaciibacter superstes]|uniref:MFS transporter n=1 Tax=Glaciibacter superstes TaxID=501023 RepID=UPI0003B4AD34|nr:MFS transporter [Glaciibacter superstes]
MPSPVDTAPLTEPIPVSSGPQPWSQTLVSLSVPNFRLFTVSNVIAMTATWMQRIAQDWLVLELTGSVAAVGITVAMQFAPMLFFGLFGGVIVDRYSKRMLLMLTQSVAAGLSLALTILTLTDAVQVWQVWVIAFLVGLVTVVDNPTRQVFVNEIVGPRYLRNAITINSSVFQLGGLIGPAVSGALIVAVGAGWSFGINTVACLVTVIALSRLKASTLHRAPPAPRRSGQLREGIRYVASKPTIFWPIVMLGFLSVFSLNMPVLLAAYASDVYDVGAGGYGLFNTLVAIGAFVGALASTRRGSIRLRTVISCGGVWAVIQATSGLMPTELLFAVVLVATGVANQFFFTAGNPLVQMSSNVRVRGRVMSVWVLVLLGGQAIGGPLMGWIVESFGPHVGMLVSGLVPATAAVVIAIILARRHQLRLVLRLPRRRRR